MNARIWQLMAIAAPIMLLVGAIALYVAPVSAAQPLAGTDASGLSDSAGKVQLQAKFADAVAKDGTRSLVVHLHMGHGWHVNAHPASMEFLIPTQVSARAGGTEVALETNYPPGVDSGIKLSGTAIKVYNDDTRIDATLPVAAVEAGKAAGSLTVAVRIQACSDKGFCLPPSRLDQRLKW